MEQAQTITAPVADDRLLYIRDVAAIYGISTKQVRRLVEAGRIPSPLEARFGNGPCWRKSAIDHHLQELK